MTDTLLIDVGHTAIKWMDTACQRSVHRADDLDQLLIQVKQALETVDQVYLAAADEGFDLETYLKLIRQAYPGVQCFQFKVMQTSVLNVEYSPLSQLGVDRWLSAVAMRALADTDACCVDFGTAITVEFLENGVYTGGYILPGFAFNAKNLSQLTNREINWQKSTNYKQLPGKNSAESVIHGYNALLFNYLENLMAQKNRAIFFTGGDAPDIEALGVDQVTYEPNMVFIGMLHLIENQVGYETL